MTKKAEVTVTDGSGKPIGDFKSKTLTKLFNQLATGTVVNFSISENGLLPQFVGNYVVRGTQGEPEEPMPEPEPPVVVPPVEPPKPPVEPPVVTPPTPSGNLLYDSNIHGKWNDGKSRTLNTKQNGQTPDDKSIFVAASGSPKLVIDGNGIAHLIGGTGEFDNLSLKLRSRHNEGGAEANRGGGEGFALSRIDWDSKRENFHNVHDSLGGGKLAKKLENNKWYSVKFTCKDEGTGKIRLTGAIGYGEGSGGVQVMNIVDSKAPGYFFDKTLLGKQSYLWIRGNNSDHPRIYICALNYDSELNLDFMFEAGKPSIALRNVRLTKL